MNIAAQLPETPRRAAHATADESHRNPATNAGFDALLSALAQGLPVTVRAAADFALQAADGALPEPGGLAKELAARQAARPRSDPVAEPNATKPIVEAARNELRSAGDRPGFRDSLLNATTDRAAISAPNERAAHGSDARSNTDNGNERAQSDQHASAQQPAAGDKTGTAQQSPVYGEARAPVHGTAPPQAPANGTPARVPPHTTGPSAASSASPGAGTSGGETGSLRSLIAINTSLDRAAARAATTTPRSAQAHPTPQDASAEAFRAQLTRGLAAALRRGDGQVVLRLHPESLGMVRVTMGVRAGAVTALLEPTTRAARELLERGLSSLRAALEARGLHVDRLVVQPNAQHLPDGKAEPSSGDGGESDRAGGDGAAGTGPEGHGRSDPRDAGAEVGAGAAPATNGDARDGAGSDGPSWIDGSAEIVVTADGAAVPIRLDVVA